MVDVTIREATQDDQAAIIALVPRLRAFGAVPFRSSEELDMGERRTIDRYFAARPEGSQFWVAELAGHSVAGAACAERRADYFTEAFHAHLSILAVADRGAGLGIGRLLIRKVEDWARENRYSFVTLNVFAENANARGFYGHVGYEADILRYVKHLS